MTHVASQRAYFATAPNARRTGLHWGCVGQGRPEEQQFKVDRCLPMSALIGFSFRVMNAISLAVLHG